MTPMTTQIREATNVRGLFHWPSQPPDVPDYMHGWWFGCERFPQFCGEQTKVIVELGSWLGKSARWFCNHCPNATVVCIDHWEGSPEFQGRFDWIVGKSYETFLRNMWKYRDRVVPLKMKTIEGVELLESLGVQPDLVYIDAGHDEESVYRDVTACLKAFPEAQIVGDDWDWNGVQRGVRAATDREIHCDWRFWWLT